jgi:hypothetical protein
MGSTADMLPPTIEQGNENKDENDSYRGGYSNRSNGRRPSKRDERAIEGSDKVRITTSLGGQGKLAPRSEQLFGMSLLRI